LAPTVTFEDSGELIAAAYNMGIPHQPGYPLFTLLGRIFSMLLVGNVAYRLNLMSAFFSSIGAMCITLTVMLIVDDLTRNIQQFKMSSKGSHIIKYTSALTAGILTATTYELWEQSIITEVYGLHTMLLGFLIVLVAMWKKSISKADRVRIYFAICYLLGLMLSNHTTSILLIPVIFLFIIIEDRRFVFDIRLLVAGFLLLILGMLPYLYLPIASSKNPLMDWGNPESLTNFFRTISRHQYGLATDQTFDSFSAQFMVYISQLMEQWFPVFLILAILGFLLFFKFQQRYFYFSLLFLFSTAPLTTYLTNFEVIVLRC
jgi:hypothetical protein